MKIINMIKAWYSFIFSLFKREEDDDNKKYAFKVAYGTVLFILVTVALMTLSAIILIGIIIQFGLMLANSGA